MKKILKRYKAWFGNIPILLCLIVYIFLDFLQSGVGGLAIGIIAVGITSFVFPPLTIIVDRIIKNNRN